MHPEDRISDIQRSDGKMCGSDGSDGASTGKIASVDKVLIRHLRFFTELRKDTHAVRIGSVSLIGGNLDDRSFVDERSACGIVHVIVVRMHTVRKICRNHE